MAALEAEAEGRGAGGNPDPWAQRTLATLRRLSPTAIKVAPRLTLTPTPTLIPTLTPTLIPTLIPTPTPTLTPTPTQVALRLLREAEGKPLAACLRAEFRAAQRFLRAGHEGESLGCEVADHTLGHLREASRC